MTADEFVAERESREVEHARLAFIEGRPCLVVTDARLLVEIAAMVEQVDRAAIYRGHLPVPFAAAFVTEARRVAAIGAMVPLPEPRRAPDTASGTRWLTTADAARLLGISQRAVRKRIAKNQLPGRMVGGRWVVDLKEYKPNAA